MTDEWKTVYLGDICRKYNGSIQTGPFGSQLHQSDYENNGIPVIMPKDIVNSRIDLDSVARIGFDNANRLSKHKVKSGDLIIPRRGDINKNTLIDKEQEGFICGTGCLKITPPSEILDSVYFKYYLDSSSAIDWLESNAIGATMKNLSGAILYKLPVILPNLTIQKKVAAILSAYDDLIENNLKQIRLLEEMAQITYQEWFVRLKFPNHENTPIDETTGLPIGWEYKKLGECCDITSSKRIFLSDYVEQGIPFYRSKEIILKSKNESLNDVLYISVNKYLEIEKSFGIPKTGDILITAVGTLGFPYLVNNSDGQFYFKDGNLIWLRDFKNFASSNYFIYVFKSLSITHKYYSNLTLYAWEAALIPSAKSRRRCSPRHKASAPGLPSFLRAKKPPKRATIKIISPNVGG